MAVGAVGRKSCLRADCRHAVGILERIELDAEEHSREEIVVGASVEHRSERVALSEGFAERFGLVVENLVESVGESAMETGVESQVFQGRVLEVPVRAENHTVFER